ncbi:MAG: response-associated peptidase [Holophagaceae bacterium]|nr:response-associated peptidase [Holophagaceae bacterium]
MCERYTFTFDARTLVEAFRLLPPAFAFGTSHNVAPGQPILIVRPEGRARVADVAYWGLIPGWVKDPNISPKPIQARAETLEEKPTFRGAFKRKRILIPASGFYAWESAGRARRPHYIQPREGTAFAFAGLMEDWQGPHGEVMISACVITTSANDLMAGIQDRMPVILPPEAWDLWLDPAAQTRELGSLLAPCPSGWMTAHPVGPEVSDTRQDHPGLILPVEARQKPLPG